MWPSNSTPVHIAKKAKQNKILILKDTCTPMLIVALFIVVKVQKQPKCPSTGEWIKKMWCICVYINTIEMLLSPKKKWHFAICRKMDGLEEYYAKRNKSEKNKYYVIALTRGI